MSKHLNYVSTEVPGWTFEAEIGSNDPILTRPISGPVQSWMSDCPQMGSGHPLFQGFILRKISIRGDVGNTVDGSLTYGPANWSVSYPGRPGGGTQIKRYGGEPAVREESILTHKNYRTMERKEFLALSNIMNGNLDKSDGSPWDADLESIEADECYRKILEGRVSVRTWGLIWVEKYTAKDLSGLELEKVNKIVANPPGNPPTPAGRNYLYLPPEFGQTEDGEQWDIVRRWEQSNDNGWDPDFYQS